MSRVRNATEFRDKLMRARAEYEDTYRPQVEAVRASYAREPFDAVPVDVDDALEAHTRQYVINAVLNALNWRLDRTITEGLPNLIPEAPIMSANSVTATGKPTIRFLDYLGTDGDNLRPLLIVETKRSSSKLPRRKRRGTEHTREDYARTIAEGLTGTDIGVEWREWLDTLRDYVESAFEQSGVAPRRVVITNGRWWIVFRDPADSFLVDGSRDEDNIQVFRGAEDAGDSDDVEDLFEELFGLLEHQRILGTTRPLTAGDFTFHIRAEDVDGVMHGLHLMYHELRTLYAVGPMLSVSPILFVRTRLGSWLRIYSQKEVSIPHDRDHLGEHLATVAAIATELLSTFRERLGGDWGPSSLEEHYADGDAFAVQPSVARLFENPGAGEYEYALVTGCETHYLNVEPTVPGCPYHDWGQSHAAGVANGPGPIGIRSTHPRAFFISTEPHHCAHREVDDAKSSQITPENRINCGPRSGGDFEAFCEIWSFEQRLCCRTCCFQNVCEKARVFFLPCQPVKE